MEAVDQTLIEQVAEKAGDSIYNCYQCQKCSSGCPAAEFMDYLPAEIIRMIQYGYKDKILSSETIWVCASCETCTTRCPNEVDIAGVMDIMREMCVDSGQKAAVSNVLSLHKSMLGSIKRNGVMFELGMLINYKLKSKKYFDDLMLGYKMFRKGKIGLLPSKIKGLKDIKRILSKY